MDQLKKELMRLLEMQQMALNRAPFLSLTPEQAKDVEARREQIRELINQLQNLNELHES